MGITSMVKNAAGRYLGRGGSGTNGRTRAGGGVNTTKRGGSPASRSGRIGKKVRGLLNRR